MKERLFNGLNTALMLNLFFVLFCFAWFAIALDRSLHQRKPRLRYLV